MNIEFQIFFPKTLNDAYRLLDQYGENAKIIAGGQSLTPMINLGLIAPTYLIDLSRIPGLTEIKEDNGGGLSVGSLATHAAVASSSLVKQKCMLLSQTASQIGDVQIRSRGTIGGSVCHADPAADYPAAAVALNATMELSNQKGTRVVPAAEFFQGMYETALQPNDVLTRVIVPASPVKSGSAYMRLCYVHGAFPIVSVAAVVALSNGVCAKIGLGLSGVDVKAVKPVKAEEYLTGKAPNDATLDEAAALAAEAVNPNSDIHASAEYRREMARVYTRRALKATVEAAKGLK